MVLLLMAVFFGANFVAGVFLTWMPTFLFRKFGMTLSLAGFSGTIYQQAGSILGVLCGGVLADRLARRYPGGRMTAQALGLLLGVPFVFLTGWTLSATTLVLAMTCFGFMKGMYDSNIWASLHDVVRPERRASAVGWMNGLAWVGAGSAAVAIGAASERFGMSACISATSLIYLAFGLLLVGGIVFHTRARARAAASARELAGSSPGP
jgi:MFS family permease